MNILSALLLLALSALSTTSLDVLGSHDKSTQSRNSVTDLAATIWHGPYFTWLTKPQKSDLDNIIDSIDSQDENRIIRLVLAKSLKYYNNLNGDQSLKATKSLDMFCKSKMTGFFGPEEVGELKKLKDAKVPNEQLFAKFNEFVMELSDREDRAQVRLYATFCKKIYKLG